MIKEYLICLFILFDLFANFNALPFDVAQEPSDLNHRADDCLLNSASIEACQNEISESGLPTKVMTCLNGCADCVRQWRAGVYDGRGCALDCIHHNENLEPPIDPDCNMIKYFNSTIVDQVGFSPAMNKTNQQ